ncbi:putative carboxylesterase 15 [Vitis vinifera]|uniref:Putative carboxylesterase 15 n=1 Tax=Vitis vinifera TaxID=29760 RepID=A0A438HZ20_VITVI|nr:putative carboxylesterase 15 [Vitis vinifera]
MDSAPHLVEDFQGLLQVYSDGSVLRSTTFPFHIPLHDDGSVVWKDSLFHKHHNLHLRLYKPAVSPTKGNLPILYYFHGGGFCVGSRTWPNCHNCCLRLASGLGALVVAPDFRLAPEHRLPAAVEDAVSSLKWLQGQAVSEDCEEWLSEGVDLDRVFVVGDSSGGNMAHQVAVQMGAGLLELEPIRVRGFVLMAPFFGGTVRTRSEEGPSDTMFNLELFDRFWRLSIPEGGTADHPLVNPFGPCSPSLEPLKLDPILVVVGGNELLKDRAEQYAKRLKEMGKGIEYVEFKGEGHGFFTNDPYSDAATAVLPVIKRFITQNS